MINQIADENGTLKHIILSVMDANEDGSQLDSTVITLPQGTFRIDSNGELVSTQTGDRISSSEGGPLQLTTLPQQSYFANYDGCLNTFDATGSTSDVIETTATTTTTSTTTTTTTTTTSNATTTTNTTAKPVTTDSSHQASDPPNSELILNDKITSDVESSNSLNKSNNLTEKSGNIKFASVTGDKASSKQIDIKLASNHQTSNGKEGVQQINSKSITNFGQNNTNEATAGNVGNPKEEVVQAADQQQQQQQIQQAEQMVVPPASSLNNAAPYPAHQVMPNEMDLMGSGMAPILSTVDGQLYSYPPCCCCCYCDPAQEASGANGEQVPLANLASQQDVGLLALPHPPTGGQAQPVPDQANSAGRSQATCRAAAANNLNHTTTGSPVMAFPTSILGRSSAIQANVAGPPIGLAPGGAPLTQAIAGQNVIVPVASGGHLSDWNAKLHPGNRGNGRNGYKQHKMVPVSVNQANNAERGQQAPYGSYGGQNNHKAYSSIVSGHHHNHHNHQQQQHYHQANSDGKNQPLLQNHQSSGAVMPGSGAGGYSSTVYYNYNRVPTTNMPNSVTSNKAANLAQQIGGVAAAGGGHKQQLAQAASSGGPAGYHPHGGRNGPNSDSNYMQRANRDQVNTYSHASNSNNSNNSASGYVTANMRQISQNNNENINKSRQALSDKSSNQQQQHNNRYTTNVKVISTNHNINSPTAATCNSLSHQSGSVSPIRAKMKGLSQHQHHHQPHQNHHHHHHHPPPPPPPTHNHNHNHHHQNQSDLGVRNSHHYGQMGANNEPTDNNLLNNSLPASCHGRDSSFNLNQSKSINKSNHYTAHDGIILNNLATKHINSANYYSTPAHAINKQTGGGWQSSGGGHKFSQFNKSNNNNNNNNSNSNNNNSSSSSNNDSSALQTSSDNLNVSSETQTELLAGKVASSAPKQAVNKTKESETTNCDVIDGGQRDDASNESHLLINRSTRQKEHEEGAKTRNNSQSKQDKCQSSNKSVQHAETNQEPCKRSPPTNAKVSGKLSNLDNLEPVAASQSNETESSKPANAKTASFGTKAADTKSKGVKDASAKQHQTKHESQPSKRKEKASGQKAGKQPAEQVSSKSAEVASEYDDEVAHEEIVTEPVPSKRKHSQGSLVSSPSTSSKLTGESIAEITGKGEISVSAQQPKHKNGKHNHQVSKNSGDSGDSHPEKVTVSRKSQQQHNDNGDKTEIVVSKHESADKVDPSEESHSMDKSHKDVVLDVSRSESPASLRVPRSNPVMRISLSENNIQSLDSHSGHHQAKQAAQRLLLDSNASGSGTSKSASTGSNRKKAEPNVTAATATTSPVASNSTSTKRRGSNSGKSEQRVKSNTAHNQVNNSAPSNPSNYHQNHHQHHHHNHHQHHQDRGNTSSHNSNSNNSGNNNSKQSFPQSMKMTNLFRQCRGKFVSMLGKLVQNSLSSYSDTKFAGLLLVIFTIFAMLLAVFIHLYIVAPVTE